MGEKQPRKILAWFAGILVFVAIFTLVSRVFSLSSISDDLPFYIGPFVAFGFLAFMIALRAGLAVYESNLRGNLDRSSGLVFNYSFIGILIYAFTSYLLGIYFRENYYLDQILLYLLDFLIIMILFSLLKPFYDVKLDALSSSHESSKEKKTVKKGIFTNLIMCAFLLAAFAAFMAYAWVGKQIFDATKSFIKGTFLEGILFLVQITVFFTIFVGGFIIFIKARDWWDGRKKSGV